MMEASPTHYSPSREEEQVATCSRGDRGFSKLEEPKDVCVATEAK
jgi:hypothetical protein